MTCHFSLNFTEDSQSGNTRAVPIAAKDPLWSFYCEEGQGKYSSDRTVKK